MTGARSRRGASSVRNRAIPRLTGTATTRAMAMKIFEQITASAVSANFFQAGAKPGKIRMAKSSGPVATTVGQIYLVSFWLTCVPDDQGVTPTNQFTAKWSGLKLYARTNLNALGWTNLQFSVTATGTQIDVALLDVVHEPVASMADDIEA